MKRKNFTIRALSVLLCTLMLVGMIPFSMSAVDPVNAPIVRYAEDWIVDVPAKFNSGGAEYSIDSETGILTISIKEAITIDGNSRFKLELADKDIDVEDYPYIAVGYTTENTKLANIDFNTTTTKNRMFGFKPTVHTGASIQKMVISVPTDYSNYSAAVDADACYRRFEFDVTTSRGTTNGTEIFKFQYIAFFKTLEEANAFTGLKKVTFYEDKAGTTEFSSYLITGKNKALVIPASTPTVAGKTFIGWFDANGEPVDATTIVDDSADFKVYPKFFVYTVKFMIDANNEYESHLYDEGETLVLPAGTPKVNDKVFKGWEGAEAGKEVTEDATYFAKWADAYKASFYLTEDDVEAYDEIQVEEGVALGELPEAPAKKGYNFVGWYIGETEVTAETVLAKNETVYAVYELAAADDVRVIYMFDDKNVFEIVETTTSKIIEAPAENPSIPGYSFKGWDYAKAEGIDAGANLADPIGTYLTEIGADIIVKPIFEALSNNIETTDLPFILYAADNETIKHANAGAYEGSYAKVEKNGGEVKVLHYTNKGEGANNKNTDKLNVIFDGFKVADYPVMKMGYKASADVKKTGADINLYFGTKKLWGSTPKPEYKAGEWAEVVYDVSAVGFNGGDTSFGGWANVGDNELTGILIMPFTNKGNDNYFDIQYVAFFKNTTDAEGFTYEGLVTMTIGDETVTVPSNLPYTLPEAPVVPFQKFSHYEDAQGNPYEAGKDITPAEGLELKAVYDENPAEFNVTYRDAQNNVIAGPIPLGNGQTLVHSDNVDLPVAPEGQMFDGWYINGTQTEIPDNYILDRDLDLIASFVSAYRYVTYKVEGKIYASQRYNKGASLEVVAAPALGKNDVFLAWKNVTDRSVVNSGFAVNENLVLEADYVCFVTKKQTSNLVFIAVLKKINEKKYAKIETQV